MVSEVHGCVSSVCGARDSGTKPLRGRVVLVTGASRGIGLAIACSCARAGAHVAIAAKTTETHPKLPGTIYSAAEEVRSAGGKGCKVLPLVCDIRFEEMVQRAVDTCVSELGGLDILVNNASAISLTPTSATTMKRLFFCTFLELYWQSL